MTSPSPRPAPKAKETPIQAATRMALEGYGVEDLMVRLKISRLTARWFVSEAKK